MEINAMMKKRAARRARLLARLEKLVSRLRAGYEENWRAKFYGSDGRFVGRMALETILGYSLLGEAWTGYSIEVSPDTLQRLRRLTKKNETVDQVMDRLVRGARRRAARDASGLATEILRHVPKATDKKLRVFEVYIGDTAGGWLDDLEDTELLAALGSRNDVAVALIRLAEVQ